ncbi:hypothetical protein [Kitasatospora kifunensis]|uniref:Uncharacterized protein n=1 Tax=Kitasatospora kifunensis TaxID=58351 RepID=A0A7W7VTW2_KITKI|nr:hypothetical protein [Kitasatospora kifunensis]MBB4922198.1 hypothetical protein [Kitasatospora kifunensis]
MATRKPKPWAVICATPDGPLRTEHTSETKAYQAAYAEREARVAGTSQATEVWIEQWKPRQDHWVYHDGIYRD